MYSEYGTTVLSTTVASTVGALKKFQESVGKEAGLLTHVSSLRGALLLNKAKRCVFDTVITDNLATETELPPRTWHMALRHGHSPSNFLTRLTQFTRNEESTYCT